MIQSLNLNYEAVVLAFGFFVVLLLFSIRYRSRPRGGGALPSPRDSVSRSAYFVRGESLGEIWKEFFESDEYKSFVDEEVV